MWFNDTPPGKDILDTTNITNYLDSATNGKIGCINTFPQGYINVATHTADIIKRGFARDFRSYLLM
jgi:hypothetical protein